MAGCWKWCSLHFFSLFFFLHPRPWTFSLVGRVSSSSSALPTEISILHVQNLKSHPPEDDKEIYKHGHDPSELARKRMMKKKKMSVWARAEKVEGLGWSLTSMTIGNWKSVAAATAAAAALDSLALKGMLKPLSKAWATYIHTLSLSHTHNQSSRWISKALSLWQGGWRRKRISNRFEIVVVRFRSSSSQDDDLNSQLADCLTKWDGSWNGRGVMTICSCLVVALSLVDPAAGSAAVKGKKKEGEDWAGLKLKTCSLTDSGKQRLDSSALPQTSVELLTADELHPLWPPWDLQKHSAGTHRFTTTVKQVSYSNGREILCLLSLSC